MAEACKDPPQKKWKQPVGATAGRGEQPRVRAAGCEARQPGNPLAGRSDCRVSRLSPLRVQYPIYLKPSGSSLCRFYTRLLHFGMPHVVATFKVPKRSKYLMGVSNNWGVLSWGPYNRNPMILAPYWVLLICGNSPMTKELCRQNHDGYGLGRYMLHIMQYLDEFGRSGFSALDLA